MKQKIAIVGVGAMGSAIAKGLANTKRYQLIGLNPVNPRVEKLGEELSMTVVTKPADLIELSPDMVILTTPAPLTIKIAASLADLPNGTAMVSAAAGISQEELAASLNGQPLATMIPNTPVAVNAGAIGLALGKGIDQSASALINEVLGSLGTVIPVKEADLDVVGVIGGCGPAFVDVMMDALSDGAVKHGLNRQVAYQVIAAMVTGTGKLALETGLAPALLRDQVASPGGTTIRGIDTLEQHGFRAGLIEAVDKASGGHDAG